MSDSKLINLIKCKSDVRVSKKERRNKSTGKPAEMELELILLLKVLKNILKQSINDNNALMKHFQDMVSIIS